MNMNDFVANHSGIRGNRSSTNYHISSPKYQNHSNSIFNDENLNKLEGKTESENNDTKGSVFVGEISGGRCTERPERTTKETDTENEDLRQTEHRGAVLDQDRERLEVNVDVESDMIVEVERKVSLVDSMNHEQMQQQQQLLENGASSAGEQQYQPTMQHYQQNYHYANYATNEPSGNNRAGAEHFETGAVSPEDNEGVGRLEAVNERPTENDTSMGRPLAADWPGALPVSFVHQNQPNAVSLAYRGTYPQQHQAEHQTVVGEPARGQHFQQHHQHAHNQYGTSAATSGHVANQNQHQQLANQVQNHHHHHHHHQQQQHQQQSQHDSLGHTHRNQMPCLSGYSSDSSSTGGGYNAHHHSNATAAALFNYSSMIQHQQQQHHHHLHQSSYYQQAHLPPASLQDHQHLASDPVSSLWSSHQQNNHSGQQQSNLANGITAAARDSTVDSPSNVETLGSYSQASQHHQPQLYSSQAGSEGLSEMPVGRASMMRNVALKVENMVDARAMSSTLDSEIEPAQLLKSNQQIGEFNQQSTGQPQRASGSTSSTSSVSNSSQSSSEPASGTESYLQIADDNQLPAANHGSNSKSTSSGPIGFVANGTSYQAKIANAAGQPKRCAGRGRQQVQKARQRRIMTVGRAKGASNVHGPSGSRPAMDNLIHESVTYKDADIEHTNEHIIVTNVKKGCSVTISNKDLTEFAVRDLNRKVAGFPRETINKLKQRRRTLKNRGYAQNCRQKRLAQKNNLERRNDELIAENYAQSNTIEELRSRVSYLTREVTLLLERNEEIRNQRQLQPHHGSDPLQETSGFTLT